MAEVALFDADGLPRDVVEESRLGTMETNGELFRFPTGADGGYLLHVYLGEEIPAEVLKYCIQGDRKEYEFKTRSGRIAFGGVESAYAEFEPHPSIRTDSQVPAGTYGAIAYRTDFPDELIEDRIEAAIGKAGVRHLDFPAFVFWGGVFLGIATLAVGVSGSWTSFSVLLLLLAGVVVWFKAYTGTDKYKDLDRRKTEIAAEYPSIVVHLTPTE